MERASVGRRAVLAGLAAGTLAGCGRAAGLGSGSHAAASAPSPSPAMAGTGSVSVSPATVPADGGVQSVGAEPG